jgi:hypothetical protein
LRAKRAIPLANKVRAVAFRSMLRDIEPLGR